MLEKIVKLSLPTNLLYNTTYSGYYCFCREGCFRFGVLSLYAILNTQSTINDYTHFHHDWQFYSSLVTIMKQPYHCPV